MNILVIAPHPDDEVLGCGGTIAKRADKGDSVYVCIVTKGYTPLFDPQKIKQGREEDESAAEVLGVKETIFLDYPAAMLDGTYKSELGQKFADIINRIKPDEVYIPHRGDVHVDHKIVSEAAMVGVRPKHTHVVKRVYAYETLSETGWDIPSSYNDFIPTVYEDVTNTIHLKTAAMAFFKSQIQDYPAPRSLEAINTLAKYRGSTVNVRYAEAFSLIREVRL